MNEDVVLELVFSDIPAGFRRIPDVQEVYTNGKLVVLLGIPIGSEDEDESLALHDCDLMGCGSCGPHVVGYAKVVSGCVAETEEASDA